MLNTIEAGAPWPDGTDAGRLVHLAKDPNAAEDPLAYRPLLILPNIYRRWAAYRLQSMDAWILSWATDAIFAGVPGLSAEDAWWLTSANIEAWQVQGKAFTGSSADIAKCFDQIVRPILYYIAGVAGMPQRVLQPYMRYMENLKVHNTIGKGIGRPYQRRCGIPQGCPLSMMLIALMLRPWVMAIESIGAMPRILADDLMILTSGIHHCQLMHKAINLTHQMLSDMGAAVAPAKSFIFTDRTSARKWYTNHIWINIGQKIPVVKHVRDLGGTINTVATKSASVIDERIRKAIITLRKMRFMPHAIATKAKFIQAKVLAGALYGIEVAEPSAHMMRKLQTAICEVLGSHSARASLPMVFELSGYSKDLDPHVQQLTRRVGLFRRMWHKHPKMQGILMSILQIYKKEQRPGTVDSPHNIKQPAPPPGHPGRARWKPTGSLWGPIALLLHSMHQVNGTIDSYFNVQFEDGGNLDIINIPSQHVNGMFEHRATDARLRWAATIRKDLKYTESLDREVLRGATKGRDMEEARILKHYMSLASWDNDKLYDAGQVDSRECEVCGHHTRTHEHLMKYCTKAGKS